MITNGWQSLYTKSGWRGNASGRAKPVEKVPLLAVVFAGGRVIVVVTIVKMETEFRRHPHFSQKSPHAAESKGVEFRSLAKERTKSSEVIGNAGVTFLSCAKECASA
jgi:hypothetical protein